MPFFCPCRKRASCRTFLTPCCSSSQDICDCPYILYLHLIFYFVVTFVHAPPLFACQFALMIGASAAAAGFPFSFLPQSYTPSAAGVDFHRHTHTYSTPPPFLFFQKPNIMPTNRPFVPLHNIMHKLSEIAKGGDRFLVFFIHFSTCDRHFGSPLSLSPA